MHSAKTPDAVRPARAHLWARVLVAATFFLIFVGAMVTSKDAGLAVPDWPLSFGSLNPPGWWRIDGVFWEHGHRLTGTMIGLITIGLCLVLWSEHRGSWIRWLGPLALAAVIAQGVMGGLRVTQISTTLAIVHGCFAQAFFAFAIFIACVTSPRIKAHLSTRSADEVAGIRWLGVAVLASVCLQLILGAIMRHWKAGLAIPDFPLAYGRIIPPFTHHGITIHFFHRVWAVVVVILVVALVNRTWNHFRAERPLARASAWLAGLVALQVALGAHVIWLVKAPVPTSLHVLTGAAILGTAVFFVVRAFSLVGHGALLAPEAPMEPRRVVA